MKFKLPAYRILALGLALVLTALARPAEGFMFYEQTSPSPAPLPGLGNRPHQVVIDLAGTWEYRCGDRGEYRPIWVPGCYIGTDEEVTLKREFTLADSLRALYFQLELPEINYQVEVWINGGIVSSFTGSHRGYSCDIGRDRLRFGAPNELVLKIDNRLSPRSTLPVRGQVLQPQGFGGIFAGVYLRGVPSWSVEDAGMLNTDCTDSAAIRSSVRVRIAKHGPLYGGLDSAAVQTDVKLYVALRDTLGRLIAEGRSEAVERGGSESFQTTVPLGRFAASLWSPERPALYRLDASLVAGTDTVHAFSRRVGFRSVQVIGSEFYLNSKRLRLRGMDYIPEAVRGARAISIDIMRSDLEKMRDLGMNAVRVPFGPPPPNLVNLADELGILVLIDGGLDWVPDEVLARKQFRTVVWHSMERTIAAFRDNVSVLAWGLGSQLNWQDPGTHEFAEWLRTTVKEQDNRPCFVETANLGSVTGLSDFVLAARRPDGQPAVVTDLNGSPVPVVISRLGQLAAIASDGRDHSAGIVNQAEYLLRQVQAIDADPAADGFFIHAFSDYHGSSPLLAQPHRTDPLLYTYGIVELNRQERIAFSKLRDLAHTGQSTPPLPVGAGDGAPIAFPVAGLAALVLLSVEMRRNNVFRQNLKRVFLHAHGFYSDLRYRRFLHTAQPLLLWLLESITLALILASFLHTLRGSFALDYYLTHFMPWPGFKGWLVNLIWDPVRLIAVCTAVFMGLILIQTLLVRLTSLLFREHTDFWQAANYVIWSFAALLYLLPLGVVFYRVVDMPEFSTIALIGVAAGIGWSFFRLVAALRTGFGSTPWRIYVTVFGIGILLIALTIGLLEQQLGTLTYLHFFKMVFAVQ